MDELTAEVVTANHTPLIPWPFACPGPESPEYVYTGIPSKVTCMLPSGRFTVPRWLATSGLAAGTFPDVASSGGQVLAQFPVHVIFPLTSVVRW